MPDTALTSPVSSLIDTVPFGNALPIAFLCLLFAYIVYSVILVYHWQAYSANPAMNTVTYAAFFCTTIPVLLVLAATAFLS